jgi:hypothetical protein
MLGKQLRGTELVHFNLFGEERRAEMLKLCYTTKRRKAQALMGMHFHGAISLFSTSFQVITT